MTQVARLRAEAYYEGNNSRFVGSLKKQFVEQETESLAQRISAGPAGKAARVECLVAVPVVADAGADGQQLEEEEEEEDGQAAESSAAAAESSAAAAVLACIDTRLPRSACGMHPTGVPEGDESGAYLLNVVVLEALRGQGLGRSLMRAAMYRAVHAHGSARLYTSVEADNDVAVRLYRGCGFEDFSTDSKFESGLKLGQTVLLMAPAAAALPVA